AGPQELGTVVIGWGVPFFFFRPKLLGIPESRDKGLKIIIATAGMGVVMPGWGLLKPGVKGPGNPLPSPGPDPQKKVEINEAGEVVPRKNPVTGEQEDPLGFLGYFPAVAEPLRNPQSWLSLLGLVGLVIAFGHSILAMSGEETLAQVYREVESPKLPN